MTAHAAHPEDAINPLSLAIEWLEQLNATVEEVEEFALITPISMKSGEHNFGVTPLKAELLVTLRSSSGDLLSRLIEKAKENTANISTQHKIKASLQLEDYFPVTVNSAFFTNLVEVCQQYSFDFDEMEEPFRWSEDFGHYAELCPTLMFGLGAGKDCPHLHSNEYDFPDELISIGSSVFSKLFFNTVQSET
jgi:metal-dependent amidase/aminoacylase/carboxypeptidase family protein